MCQLLSQRPLPPARHQPHPLTPSTQTIVQEEKKKKEKKKDQLSANHIILPSPATQNTGLKEVDLEPKPKGSSDKINKLRPKSQNTTENSCIIQPGLTFEKTPLREVDLQPRAQRGNERIEALMSL